MIRAIDLFISAILFLMTLPIQFVCVVLIFIVDKYNPIFVQERVGLGLKPFWLYKLRTMHPGTPALSTHEIHVSRVGKIGKYLRKYKLDELPQLINVIKGEMSLVGARPCLLNQSDVISERLKLHVMDHRPGITGLSQINNIDMSTPELLAITDAEMIKTLSLKSYFEILVKTILGSGRGDKINNKL